MGTAAYRSLCPSRARSGQPHGPAGAAAPAFWTPWLRRVEALSPSLFVPVLPFLVALPTSYAGVQLLPTEQGGGGRWRWEEGAGGGGGGGFNISGVPGQKRFLSVNQRVGHVRIDCCDSPQYVTHTATRRSRQEPRPSSLCDEPGPGVRVNGAPPPACSRNNQRLPTRSYVALTEQGSGETEKNREGGVLPRP